MTNMEYYCQLLIICFALFEGHCLGLPNPVGLYPLDGSRKAADISCNNNPEGKLSGVKLSKGPDGLPLSAYKFSASRTSYIEIPGNSYTDVKYSMTLLASVFNSGYAGPIIDYANDGLGVNLWMTGPDTLNGRFITRDGANNVFLSSNNIGLRFSWHYVGLTFNFITGTAELFIDGDSVRRLYLGRTELKTQGSIRLGAVEHDDRYFRGKISCLQIYDKALSEVEIRQVQGRCSMIDPVNCSITAAKRVERHMTSLSGTFSSPGYPRGYPADSDYIWTIKVPSGKKIVLVFSNMDLQQSSSCPDQIKVLDGLTSWSAELREFCHTTEGKNNKVTSSSNAIRVEFRSDSAVSGKGFTVSYTTHDKDTGKEDRVLDLSVHYTGIVIGVACAALFTVLSIMAVSHTRRRMRRRHSSTFSDRHSSVDGDEDVIRQGAPPSYDIVMRCPDLYPPSPQMSPASSIISTPAIQPRFKIPPRITSPLASRATSPDFSATSPWHSGQLSSNASRNPSGNCSPDNEDPPPYPGIVVVSGDTVLGPHYDFLYGRGVITSRVSTPSLHTSDMRGLLGSDSRIYPHPRSYLRTRSSDLTVDRNLGLHRLQTDPQGQTETPPPPPASGSSQDVSRDSSRRERPRDNSTQTINNESDSENAPDESSLTENNTNNSNNSNGIHNTENTSQDNSTCSDESSNHVTSRGEQSNDLNQAIGNAHASNGNEAPRGDHVAGDISTQTLPEGGSEVLV